MSLQNDFLMRQIVILTRFIGQVFYKKKGQEHELIVYDHCTAQDNEALTMRLLAMVEVGHINEAENDLFRLFEKDCSEANFATAVCFYEKLLALDESILAEYDFSRAEIGSVFAEICQLYGILTVL